MTRIEHLVAALLTALAISASGCYTKVGNPDPYADLYGSDADYGAVGYWTESYYAYAPSPWQAYPGHNWWYDEYHRYWVPPRGHSGWSTVETGRSRYDRGPGVPSGTTTGGGGHISAGPPPAATGAGPAAPPAANPRTREESTNPGRQRAVSGDEVDTTRTESTEPTRTGRRR